MLNGRKVITLNNFNDFYKEIKPIIGLRDEFLTDKIVASEADIKFVMELAWNAGCGRGLSVGHDLGYIEAEKDLSERFNLH